VFTVFIVSSAENLLFYLANFCIWYTSLLPCQLYSTVVMQLIIRLIQKCCMCDGNDIMDFFLF